MNEEVYLTSNLFLTVHCKVPRGSETFDTDILLFFFKDIRVSSPPFRVSFSVQQMWRRGPREKEL